MKTTLFSLALGLTLALGACGGPSPSGGKTLADCPEVLTVEDTPSGPVSVLHIDRVKDTIDVPLSKLLDDFRMVRLDNREEALTKGYPLMAFDNYFIIGGGMNEPCHLFDKNGHYLCDIGGVGQGPGEYTFVYDAQIDEANQCIYLMPWMTQNLLAYNMQGKYQHPIPLPTYVPKGVFTVDPGKQTVTVGMLPFSDIEGASVVWQQDFKGNVLHRVDAAPYSVIPDFSNEIANTDNVPGVFDFTIQYWEAKDDTLFHYLPEEGRFAPMLTLQQPNDKQMHSYLELPDHYLMDIILQMQYQQTDHSTVGFPSRRACVLMDKHTGKGAFVRFFNDLIENSAVVDAFYYFKKGHFAYAIDPGDLLVQVEELLSSSKTDDKTRSRLEELKSTIDPDDNTYLFVGKIKSNAQL